MTSHSPVNSPEIFYTFQSAGLNTVFLTTITCRVMTEWRVQSAIFMTQVVCRYISEVKISASLMRGYMHILTASLPHTDARLHSSHSDSGQPLHAANRHRQ